MSFVFVYKHVDIAESGNPPYVGHAFEKSAPTAGKAKGLFFFAKRVFHVSVNLKYLGVIFVTWKQASRLCKKK